MSSMKLETLKRRAQQSTKARGHAMAWRAPFGNVTTLRFAQVATCRHCGAEVMINTHPAPNDIDIGGPAVALNCTGRGAS